MFRIAADGDAVVVRGYASLYVGTGRACALGDTRPEVGPAGWGSSRVDVRSDPDLLAGSWSYLREDVVAHLAGGGQPEATGPAISAAALPAAAVPVRGGRAWAVFVAVARDMDDERLDQAVEDRAAVGYETWVSEVGCFQGAAEALGLDPARSYLGVSVEFASAAEAQQMVEAFEPGVVGTAEVVTYCLD